MAADSKENENPKKEVDEKIQEVLSLPPLEAAARRLDRLLGGGVSGKSRVLHSYTNPAKVVRRWLGTASGASAEATLESIAAAAKILLNGEGPCAGGKALITAGVHNMDTSSEEKTDEDTFLTKSSEREVEAWLLSLMVRIYWREKKFADAFDLARNTVVILVNHIDAAETNVTNSVGPGMASLFPLLARMHRYQSLVAESLTQDRQVAATLRQEMIKSHGMACLRRDVDSQATLLNLMLRDLLNDSQGRKSEVCRSDFPLSNYV